MGAFAVFGVSRQDCYESAKKKTPRSERVDDKGDEVRWLSEGEWLAKVALETDRQYAARRPTAVSARFDAPQFAEEFLRRALERPGEFRDLCIMVSAPTGHKNERTGAETTKWVPLSQLESHMRERDALLRRAA